LGSGYGILSQGFADNKEGKIQGRYIHKKIDIAITRNGEPVAGVAVKFVMQNYSQNSNNYFENMLGETANIRSSNYPYFQIFIILDKLPYYDTSKKIKRWETFTAHNASKYLKLSQDNIDAFFHTPNKTLIYIVHIPDNERLLTKNDYMDYYKKMDFQVTQSQNSLGNCGDAVIINDYEIFREKLYHTIKAL